MVIKGGARGSGAKLAVHLARADTNEFVAVRGLDGVAAKGIAGAIAEMEAVASGTRCWRPLYHASINTPLGETMTPEQWMYAVNRLGHELGFDDQARLIVEHVKDGRQHIHVVWSRIETESMRTISDSHNYRTHERTSRALEQEFGHKHVEGVHTGDKSKDRPVAEIGTDEQQQADRLGIPVRQVRADLTAAWEATDSGQAFADLIDKRGYILAQGDKRDYVVIDEAGGLHSPRRRMGLKAAEVHERFADLDPAELPTVAEAREIVAERQRESGERKGGAAGDPPDAIGTDQDAPPLMKPPASTEDREDPEAGAWERAGRLFRDWTERTKEMFVSWHRRLMVMIGQETGPAPIEAKEAETPTGQDTPAADPAKAPRTAREPFRPAAEPGKTTRTTRAPFRPGTDKTPPTEEIEHDGPDIEPDDSGGRDDE